MDESDKRRLLNLYYRLRGGVNQFDETQPLKSTMNLYDIGVEDGLWDPYDADGANNFRRTAAKWKADHGIELDMGKEKDSKYRWLEAPVDDGDYEEDGENEVKDDWDSSPSGGPFSYSVSIPPHTLKKIDPYYKDYMREWVKLAQSPEAAAEFGEEEQNTGYNNFQDLSQILNLRALKNINSSTNKAQALRFLKNFLDDHFHNDDSSFTYDYDFMNTRYDGQPDTWDYVDKVAAGARYPIFNKDEKFSSLNQIRAFNTAWREQETAAEFLENVDRRITDQVNTLLQQRADAKGLDYRKLNAAQLDKLVPPEEIEQLKLKAIEEADRPFVYTPQVKKLVEGSGWELAESPVTLRQRGKDMNHCVGSYGEKVRDNRSYILTKGDQTAEIQTVVDPTTGIITKATINQVKGPHNRPDDENKEKELQKITKALPGLPARISEEAAISAEDTQNIVSDRLMKIIKGNVDEDALINTTLSGGRRFGL